MQWMQTSLHDLFVLFIYGEKYVLIIKYKGFHYSYISTLHVNFNIPENLGFIRFYNPTFALSALLLYLSNDAFPTGIIKISRYLICSTRVTVCEAKSKEWEVKKTSVSVWERLQD